MADLFGDTQKLRDAGWDDNKIRTYWQGEGASQPDIMLGMRPGNAMVTQGQEAADPIADVGTGEMLWQTAKRTIGGAPVGIMELLGMKEQGTLAKMEEEFQDKRVDWLAGGRGATGGKAAVAGLSEFAASMVPVAPGGALGSKALKVAAKSAPKLVASRLGRAAVASAPGAVEGGLVGLGESQVDPNASFWDRTKAVAIGAGLAGGMGTLAGRAAKDIGPNLTQNNLPDIADPNARAILDRGRTRNFGESDTSRGTFRERIIDSSKKAGAFVDELRGKDTFGEKVDFLVPKVKQLGRSIYGEMIDELAPIARIGKRFRKADVAGAETMANTLHQARIAARTDTAPVEIMTRRWNNETRSYEQTKHQVEVVYDARGKGSLVEVEGEGKVLTDIVRDMSDHEYADFETYLANHRYLNDVVPKRKAAASAESAQIASTQARERLQSIEASIKEVRRKAFQAPTREFTTVRPETKKPSTYEVTPRKGETTPGLPQPKNEAFPHTRTKTRKQWRDIEAGLKRELDDAQEQFKSSLPAARKERGARGTAKKWLESEQKTIGEAAEELDAIQATYGSRMDDKAAEVREWSIRAHLEPLRAIGRITDDEMIRILETNKNYATFSRLRSRIEGKVENFKGKKMIEDPDTGEMIEVPRDPMDMVDELLLREGIGEPPSTSSSKTAPIFKMKQGTIEGIDPVLESMSVRAMQVDSFVKKQVVRKELIRLHRQNPELVPEIREMHRMEKASSSSFEDIEGGKKTRWEATPELARALDGMEPREVHWALKPFRAISGVVRAGATLAPAFPARNIIRDQFSLSSYSKNGAIGGFSPAKAFLEDLGLFGPKAKAVMRQFTDEFDAAAGSGGNFLGEELARVKRARSPERLIRGKRNVREYFNPLTPLRAFSDKLEKVTRLTEFSLARKAGKSIDQAAYESADVTLNFSRSGKTGKIFNGLEAFFNAEMQDVDKFSRALGNKKTRARTMLQAGKWITAPALANAALHVGDEHYHEGLPTWEKMLFYHVPSGMLKGKRLEGTMLDKSGRYLRIPRPLGVLNLIFGLGPEAAANAAFAGALGGKPGDALKQYGEAVIEQTPAHFIGQPTDMLPTAAEPIVESVFNYDPFFESPIESHYQQGLLPEDREMASTTRTARALGNAVRQIPGVGKYSKWSSPILIDHLLNSYGATLGKDVLSALDPALEAAGIGDPGAGMPSVDPLGKSKNPFKAGFQSSSVFGMGSEPVRDLYDFFENAAKAQKSLKKWENTGDPRAATVYDEYPHLYFYDTMLDAKNEISELSAMRRMATTPEEALWLDQAITQIALAANYAVAEGILDIEETERNATR